MRSSRCSRSLRRYKAGPESVDAEAVRASGVLGQMRRDHLWDAPPGDPEPLAQYWRLGPLLQAGSAISAERYRRRHAPQDGD